MLNQDATIMSLTLGGGSGRQILSINGSTLTCMIGQSLVDKNGQLHLTNSKIASTLFTSVRPIQLRDSKIDFRGSGDSEGDFSDRHSLADSIRRILCQPFQPIN